MQSFVQASVSSHVHAGCLLQEWKNCKTHRQKQELARKVAVTLQAFDVTTAQNLPDKDPEVLDQPRFSWRNLMIMSQSLAFWRHA